MGCEDKSEMATLSPRCMNSTIGSTSKRGLALRRDMLGNECSSRSNGRWNRRCRLVNDGRYARDVLEGEEGVLVRSRMLGEHVVRWD